MILNTKLMRAIFLSFIVVICLFAHCACAFAAKTEPLKASVSQNEVTDQLESFGIKSVIHVSVDGKNTIYADSVRMGSKAFYKGVEAGDLIRGLVQKDSNTFCLNIERKGTPYQIVFTGVGEKATLDPSGKIPSLSVPLGQRDIPQLPIETAKTEKSPPKEKALTKYDIELIIDISGSMSASEGTGNLSKFQWCHEQVRDLSRKLAPYERTLTITTFNQSFSTEENCTSERVESVYANTTPAGGTDLVDPLKASFERARRVTSSQRKALIAVITDGMPNIPRDPSEVNRAIVDFTQGLYNADQVVITVLQIGDNFNGQDFCQRLDDNLISEGAKFDIVTTQTFDHLKERGLTDSLVDSIVDTKLAHTHGSYKSHSAAVSAASANVEKLREERAKIEKQLLGN